MKYLVKTPHNSNYPNPVSLQVGDRVRVGKTDTNFPGWIWVTTADGNQGWAPVQFLEINEVTQTAICTHDYCADELNTEIGEPLVLHCRLNGWGWVENEHKESGWVPMESIQPVDEN